MTKNLPVPDLSRRALVAGLVWPRVAMACILAAAASAATFTVTTTNSSGSGSLRQAILDANAAPGADMIAFHITNATRTILPTGALPIIRGAVTIDGTTQPGYDGRAIVAQRDAVPENNRVVLSKHSLISLADLNVSISSSSNPVPVGRPVTITLTVSNLGPDLASNVWLRVNPTLGVGVEWVSATGSFEITDRELAWLNHPWYCDFRASTIPPMTSVTLALLAVPGQASPLRLEASTSSSTADPVATNGSASAEVTVVPGPGVLYLRQPWDQIVTRERSGSVMLEVERTSGSIGTVTVAYTTLDETAMAGEDYTATRGILIFTPGQARKTIIVPLREDNIVECTKSFRVQLSDPTGGAHLSKWSNAVVRIIDNVRHGGNVQRVGRYGVGENLRDGPRLTQLSEDGRFVLIGDVVPGESHPTGLYLRDRKTGGTKRIPGFGTPGPSNYGEFALSGNGEVAVFTPGSGLGHYGIFAYRRGAATSEWVTTTLTGVSNSCTSSELAVSSNGQFVVFVSNCPDLVTNDVRRGQTHPPSQVYVRDLAARQTTLISVSTNGRGGNGACSGPRISADGRYVAFASQACDLASGDTNQNDDIFVRDRLVGITRLIGRAAGPGSEGRVSIQPEISSDGSKVAFFSSLHDLVPGLRDYPFDYWGLFVHDSTSGVTRLVSRDWLTGRAVRVGGRRPQFSTDARRLVFDSYSTNLTPVATPSHGNQVHLIDWNYDSWNQVYLYDWDTDTNRLISINCSGSIGVRGNVGDFQIAGNGRFVVFQTDAADAMPGVQGEFRQVYRRDLALNATELCSRNFRRDGGGRGLSRPTGISFDGAVVLFESDASDLLAATTKRTGAYIWRADSTASPPAPTSEAAGELGTIQCRPALSIRGEGGQSRIEWPSNSEGWHLEHTERLAPDAMWTPITAGITDTGVVRSYLLCDPASPIRFYRLRKE